ncbi:MAG: SDR family oxidoreductase [Pseudomonadota bacterium]
MASANGRKSIFVTGAASGIGRATAEHFAQQGWFCGLFDVDAAGLKQTADTIGADNCVTGVFDVRDRNGWADAITQFAGATNGDMDVLFNNAGVGRHGWFEDIPAEDSDWIVDVNVKGVINGVYASLPLLKKSNGRIINVASAAGLYGAPRLAVYSATKFAVRGLTEALDVEFESIGVSCVSLMPFFIDTPILNMPTGDGSNHALSDTIKAQNSDVYPVSDAAEQAWEAAHGKDLHYTVGKRAAQTRFWARFMPKNVRKQLLKSLPSRA